MGVTVQLSAKVGRQVVGAPDVDLFIGAVHAEVEEGRFFGGHGFAECIIF
jgi:hypothetical protein